jgi:hypothetical protein
MSQTTCSMTFAMSPGYPNTMARHFGLLSLG